MVTNKVYEYTTEGTPDCVDRDMVVNYPNVQGPDPDVFDTVLTFFAFGMFCLCLHNCAFSFTFLRPEPNVCFTHGYYHDIAGDTPYDKDAETCIAEDGEAVEDPCGRFDCGSSDTGVYENTW